MQSAGYVRRCAGKPFSDPGSIPGASTCFSRGFLLILGLPALMCRVCAVTVEQTHGVAPYVGAEMGVAHGHLDRRVPEQLLHGLGRYSSHHEMRGERVPECMPADAAKSGALARAPERPLALALREQIALLVGEDQFALEVTLLAKRMGGIVRERNLPGRVHPWVCR